MELGRVNLDKSIIIRGVIGQLGIINNALSKVSKVNESVCLCTMRVVWGEGEAC